MREIADQLICDITGIADPHQRIDLAKASPFVREWAEGVFVWLSKRDVQERKRVSELEALLQRVETPDGDQGPEEKGKGRGHQAQRAASWSSAAWWEAPPARKAAAPAAPVWGAAAPAEASWGAAAPAAPVWEAASSAASPWEARAPEAQARGASRWEQPRERPPPWEEKGWPRRAWSQ